MLERYGDVGPRHILITSFTYPPDHNGVAHVVAAQAQDLAINGHRVTVATSVCDGPDQPPPLSGIDIRRFRVRGNGEAIVGAYSGQVREYQDFVASVKVDITICHCWQIWTTDLAAPVLRTKASPAILYSHGVSATCLQWSPRGLAHWVLWRNYVRRMPQILECFDHIVFLSDMRTGSRFYDRRLVDRLGYPGYSVVPNGVDLERFRPAHEKAIIRVDLGLGSGLLVLCVSNYSPVKDQRRALHTFLNAMPKSATLVFIGAEINEYARMLIQEWELRKMRGARQSVLFKAGFTQEQIASAMSVADIFLLTSKTELQPLVILEAMAAGVPFVSTDVGCVRQLPGGDVASDQAGLDAALRRLATNESLRLEMGLRGRQAVVTNHDKAASLARFRAIVEQVAIGKRGLSSKELP